MKYQVGIIGAGLAGLSLAIQLSKAGFSVVLFEKSEFPFHKLCGEYLSRESLPFLESLGFNYKSVGPAEIDRLLITTASGKKLSEELPLGGIGISRWKMDDELSKIAKKQGVELLENTLVQSTEFIDNKHVIKTKRGRYECTILVSAFGKKSNLSGQNRLSSQQNNNYVGIKYHARLKDYPSDLISIHNFNDGYCGVCRLEKDWVSICYLSHTNNLKKSGNSLIEMQNNVLFANKEIANLFNNAEFLYEKPIAVSNISFKKKKLSQNHVIYLGDAAGMITPICGNGMSMSLHGSAILAPLITENLQCKISFDEVQANYKYLWNKEFKTRMAIGRMLQKVLRREFTADIGLSVLKKIPVFNQRLLRLTHGRTFS